MRKAHLILSDLNAVGAKLAEFGFYEDTISHILLETGLHIAATESKELLSCCYGMLRNHEHKAAGSGSGAALVCSSQYLGDWAHLQQALGPAVVIVTRYCRDVGAV